MTASLSTNPRLCLLTWCTSIALVMTLGGVMRAQPPAGPQRLAAGSPDRQIVVGLPRPHVDERGHVVVQPNVSSAEDAPSQPAPFGFARSLIPDRIASRLDNASNARVNDSPPAGEPEPLLHSHSSPQTQAYPPVATMPVFEQFMSDAEFAVADSQNALDNLLPLARWCGPLTCLFSGPGYDAGIGHERVMHALFEMDTTAPMNRFRFRVDAAYDLEFPDRAEVFWAATPGPKRPALPESRVDYQDFRFLYEIGGERFSTQTEMPIRVLDPEVNGNTAGPSDMRITTKTVLIDGDTWQVTQIFRSYLTTGSAFRGTGTGHTSLEPGLLARFKSSETFYCHFELKYYIPIAGDPFYSGQFLRYGVGFSHLAHENDMCAIMPTLEFVGWSVLDGLRTAPDGTVESVDGEGIMNIYPGVRVVIDTDSDLGLWEFGLGNGFRITNDHWYQEMLRFEVQLSH